MEDPRIISALFIFLKMAYYNVLINSGSPYHELVIVPFAIPLLAFSTYFLLTFANKKSTTNGCVLLTTVFSILVI